MATVTSDQIYYVWRDLPEHTWWGVRNVVESRDIGIPGITRSLIVRASEEFEHEGEPFPDSQDDLKRKLNNRMAYISS